jgi:hypothetical protein
VTPKFISRSDPAAIWTRRCGSCGRRGEAEFRRALEIARAAGGDLAANAERPADTSNGRRSPMRQMPRFLAPDASGASVDQVDCLVRAEIEIGHIRRLTVGVFPAQIHVTILALRYFSPRPLAGFQRA